MLKDILLAYKKGGKELKKNALIYFATGFLIIILLTLFLIFNDSFVNVISNNINQIYEEKIISYETGFSMDIGNNVKNIFIFTLIWFIEFFIITSLIISILHSLAINKLKKLSLKYSLSSVFLSLIIAIIISNHSFLKYAKAESIFLVFSLILFSSIFYKQIGLKKHFLSIKKTIKFSIIASLFYFILIILFFSLNLMILLSLGNNPYALTFFNIALTFILSLINIFVFHVYLHSIFNLKSFKQLINSVFSKKSFIFTLIFVFIGFILLRILALVRNIFPRISLFLFSIMLGISIPYISKSCYFLWSKK